MRGIAVSLMLVGASVVVTACSPIRISTSPSSAVETDPPDVLYKQALANMNKGNMTEASRKFEAIDKQYPFTEWGQKALVMQTFIATRTTNKNDVAIASGSRFLRQYPRSKDAAYVQYMIGLAYSKQISDVTQDQRAAQRTIEAMNKVVTDYPDSEYVPDAQAKIVSLATSLPAATMQVGRYYLERKEYLAAVSRFRIVVEQYQNTNRSKKRSRASHRSLLCHGSGGRSPDGCCVLGNNYPDSQWYADSYKAAEGSGSRAA